MQFIDVLDYGADPTNTTDSTAAFQTAINYAAAHGGGRVNVPAGTFKFTLGALFGANGVELCGAGQFVTILEFQNGSDDCIRFKGGGYAAMWSGTAIRDLSINGIRKNGGRAIFLQYCFNAMVERVYIVNCWNGIEDLSCNTVVLRDVSIAGVLSGAGGWGIYFHGTPTELNIQITMFNVLVNALWTGADGIRWDGAAYTMNAILTTCLDVAVGLRVLNTSKSNSYYPQYFEGVVFTVDGASQTAVVIAGGGNFHFTGSNLQNTTGEGSQGDADTNAVIIETDSGGSETHEVYFTNCNIGFCKQSAVVTGGKSVTFNGCRFGAGITTPPNTYPAVQVTAGASDTIITGCSNGYFGNQNNWNYGVQMDAGSTRTLVTACDFTIGSQTGPILNNSGDPYTYATLFLGGPAQQPGAINQLPGYTAPPPAPERGQMYIDLDSGQAYYWNGTVWVSF